MNNDPVQLKMFLSSLAVNVPVLLVCFVAGIVVLGRWREGGSGSVFAALGFGLVLVLCFVLPLGQTLIQHWVFENGQREARMWALTGLGIVGSVLRAVSYVLLLAAIYAGRPKTGSV
jgi:hypothetical protein